MEISGIKVELSKMLQNECVKFAERTIGSHAYYSRSGQSNQDNIKSQIVTGKMGEIATCCVLGTPIPDFSLHTKKSFDADLLKDYFKFHLKSQDFYSANKYGLSWTFQFGEKSGRKDSLFLKNDANDIVILCLVNDLTVYVCGALPFFKCLNVFKDPVLDRLKNEKKVIYYKDLGEIKWSFDIPAAKQNYCL